MKLPDNLPRIAAVVLAVYIICVLVYLLAYSRGAKDSIVLIVANAKKAFDAGSIENGPTQPAAAPVTAPATANGPSFDTGAVAVGVDAGLGGGAQPNAT